MFGEDNWSISQKWHDSGDLSDVCFHQDGGLIQGSPLSPAIFHQYCSVVLDKCVSAFCESRRIIYTRYVDDILISSKKPMGKRVRKILRSIIRSCGFSLNEDKDKVVCTFSTPLSALGMVIYRGRVCVSSEFLSSLKKERNHANPNMAKITGMKAWFDLVESLNDP